MLAQVTAVVRGAVERLAHCIGLHDMLGLLVDSWWDRMLQLAVLVKPPEAEGTKETLAAFVRGVQGAPPECLDVALQAFVQPERACGTGAAHDFFLAAHSVVDATCRTPCSMRLRWVRAAALAALRRSRLPWQRGGRSPLCTSQQRPAPRSRARSVAPPLPSPLLAWFRREELHLCHPWQQSARQHTCIRSRGRKRNFVFTAAWHGKALVRQC
jgi:hypothetical protein